MKKLGMVLGVAAVAVVAGCKDPDYRRAGASAQNEVKTVAPAEETTPPPPPPAIKVAEAPHCTCPHGTRHTRPCACGAPDCQCIVTPRPVAPKPVEPEYTVYVVQNGDYLAKISKRFNVTINSIKQQNGLKSDMIRVGQRLKIPGRFDVGEQKAPAVRKAAAKPANTKAASAYTGATKEYVVKGGDTLGAIAYGNGITIRQLKAMNGLSGDTLKVGQKLKVPAEKVAKAAAAKAEKKAAAPAAVPTAEPAAAPTAETAAPTAETAAPTAETAAPAAETAAAPVETPAAETAAAPATFAYTVQEGEDITAIVVKFGVSASEIRELNSLGESDTLKAGQTIKLPAEAQQ